MKLIIMFAATAALLLGPPGARAALISGQLATFGSAIVDADDIDWTPLATGEGVFGIDPFVGNTGSFLPLAGTTGDILDLNLAAAPVGVPNLGIANFITFDAAPTLTFTLNFIAPGPFSSAECFDPPAAGQECSFPGSPFGLTNASVNSSDVNLVLFGTVSDGSGDPPSAWRGTFTTQFNESYQSLLNKVFVQGGSVANTYSATFIVTPIPEPATALLLGAGLLGLVWVARRKTS